MSDIAGQDLLGKSSVLFQSYQTFLLFSVMSEKLLIGQIEIISRESVGLWGVGDEELAQQDDTLCKVIGTWNTMPIYTSPCEGFLEWSECVSESLDQPVAVTAAFLLNSASFICYVIWCLLYLGQPGAFYGSSACFVILSALFTVSGSQWCSCLLPHHK